MKNFKSTVHVGVVLAMSALGACKTTSNKEAKLLGDDGNVSTIDQHSAKAAGLYDITISSNSSDIDRNADYVFKVMYPHGTPSEQKEGFRSSDQILKYSVNREIVKDDEFTTYVIYTKTQYQKIGSGYEEFMSCKRTNLITPEGSESLVRSECAIHLDTTEMPSVLLTTNNNYKYVINSGTGGVAHMLLDGVTWNVPSSMDKQPSSIRISSHQTANGQYYAEIEVPRNNAVNAVGEIEFIPTRVSPFPNLDDNDLRVEGISHANTLRVKGTINNLSNTSLMRLAAEVVDQENPLPPQLMVSISTNRSEIAGYAQFPIVSDSQWGCALLAVKTGGNAALNAHCVNDGVINVNAPIVISNMSSWGGVIHTIDANLLLYRNVDTNKESKEFWGFAHLGNSM